MLIRIFSFVSSQLRLKLPQNGYYKWEQSLKAYIKTEVPAGEWRIPDVYDMVSR